MIRTLWRGVGRAWNYVAFGSALFGMAILGWMAGGIIGLVVGLLLFALFFGAEW